MSPNKWSLAAALAGMFMGGAVFAAQPDGQDAGRSDQPNAAQQETDNQPADRNQQETDRDADARDRANRNADNPQRDAQERDAARNQDRDARQNARNRGNRENAPESVPAPPGADNADNQNRGQQGRGPQGRDARPQEPGGQDAGRQGANIGVQFRAGQQGGLMVGTVQENSFAQQVGLQTGDQIVSAGGRTFESPQQLRGFLMQQSGEQVPIVVLRDGERQTLQWHFDQTAQQRFGQPGHGQSHQGQPGEGSQKVAFGIVLWDSPSGVFVRRVHPNSPAWQAGLQPNDRIVRWNDEQFQDYHEFMSAAGQAELGQESTFIIDRNGRQMTFQIEPQEYAVVYSGQQLGPGQGTPQPGGRQPFGVARPSFEQFRQGGNLQQEVQQLRQQVQQLQRELDQVRAQVREFHGDAPSPDGQGNRQRRNFRPGQAEETLPLPPGADQPRPEQQESLPEQQE